MTRNLIISLAVAVCLSVMCSGQSSISKACSIVEPAANFSMEKFLGVWHIIESTTNSKNVSCISVNVTKGKEQRVYIVLLSALPLGGNKTEQGAFPLISSVVNEAMMAGFTMTALQVTVVVFATDYDNYAGVWTCMERFDSKKYVPTILSRKKTLDKETIAMVHSRLSNFGVSLTNLTTVDQTNCPIPEFKLDDRNIKIADNVPSSTTASVVARLG